MRFHVEIEKRGGSYVGTVARDGSQPARKLSDLKLGPDSEVEIKGEKYTLGKLVEALVNYDEADLLWAFDERGQVELGQHLFGEVFGWMGTQERDRLKEAAVDVRIASPDEHVTRLPWVLLADRGIFLSVVGWSVALTPGVGGSNVELPPSPKILVVMPQPAVDEAGDPVEPTGAEAHLENLEEMLSGADHMHTLGKNLRVARTWEEFTREVQTFRPCVVYYYGHGLGDLHTSRLRFTQGESDVAFDVPMPTFANILRDTPGGAPLLAYVNCCGGDAGGAMGAGRQLSDFIPAVITNSTVAETEAAQTQALALWRSLLLLADPPHVAVASLRGGNGWPQAERQTHTLADVRWMTPVIYCRYKEWAASRPNPPDRLERDPHWRFKLDRKSQFGLVSYQTSQMLRELKPRSRAYVWYGTLGQGVDKFHQRLTVEIQELFSNTFVYEVQPNWPPHLADSRVNFRDMLREAFRVGSWANIPGQIRTASRGRAGVQTLVYVRHLPVESPHVFNPESLSRYLSWWDEIFTPMLEQGNAFGLLGISFVVRKPGVFKSELDKYIGHLDFETLVIEELEEMGQLTRKDISDFIKSHSIRLPSGRRDAIIDKIFRDSGGEYEKALETLKRLEETHWDINAGAQPAPAGGAAQQFSY